VMEKWMVGGGKRLTWRNFRIGFAAGWSQEVIESGIAFIN
jgi:hypothetical protein